MNKYVSSTLLINALFTEVSEMQKLVQNTPCTTKATLEGISIPVNKEVSTFTGGQGTKGQISSLLESINHDCYSVKADLQTALRISYEAVTSDEDAHIYGIIWASDTDNNFRLNLLHPIVINSILQGEYAALIQMESLGTLYIYEYTNKGAYKPKHEFADEVLVRWVEILEVINTESYSPNTTLTCSTNMSSLCNAIRQGATPMEQAKVAFSESGSNPRHVITPTMFVTQGMLFPYYGAIQSRNSGSGYDSRDLMHFGSCNLNHSRDIGNWGSTCTGNLSSSVYASLRVLTNLNTGSPHHTDVIAKGTDVRTYVKTTQEISMSLLYEANKHLWEAHEVVNEPSEEVIEAVKEPSEEALEVTPEVTVKRRGRPSKSSSIA